MDELRTKQDSNAALVTVGLTVLVVIIWKALTLLVTAAAFLAVAWIGFVLVSENGLEASTGEVSEQSYVNQTHERR